MRFRSFIQTLHPFLLTGALAASACSSGNGSTGTPGNDGAGPGGGSDGGSGGSSSSSSGGAPSGSDAGVSDAASPDAPAESSAPPPFVSNLPGATVVPGAGSATGLVLVSLNFLQQPSSGMVYQQWLGEVQNVGTSIACTVALDLVLRDAGGNVVVQPSTTYVDAAPYTQQGYPLTAACIAPGTVGSFYQNGFASTMADAASVASIGVKLTPSTLTGYVPDPDAPLITAQPVPYLGAYALKGTLTGQGASINNIGLHVYPRDPLGLVTGQITANDLGTLDPATTFAFTTDTVTEAFTDYRAFTSYSKGP